MPPGASLLWTMWTSIAGASLMRSDLVVVEVALLDAAVLDRDLAIERGGEAEDDAALHLRLDRVRVDDRAAVDGADHALRRATWPSLPTATSATCGDVAAEAEEERDAAALPAGSGLPQPAFSAARSSTACGARRLVEQRAAIVDRILAWPRPPARR